MLPLPPSYSPPSHLLHLWTNKLISWSWMSPNDDTDDGGELMDDIFHNCDQYRLWKICQNARCMKDIYINIKLNKNIKQWWDQTSKVGWHNWCRVSLWGKEQEIRWPCGRWLDAKHITNINCCCLLSKQDWHPKSLLVY